MRLMLRPIMKPRLGRIKLTLLLLLSTGALLSCKAPSAPPFPTSTLIEYDAQNKICGQYKIINFNTFQFAYVKDIDCPAIFGFTVEDTPKVLNWSQDMIQYGQAHCN